MAADRWRFISAMSMDNEPNRADQTLRDLSAALDAAGGPSVGSPTVPKLITQKRNDITAVLSYYPLTDHSKVKGIHLSPRSV